MHKDWSNKEVIEIVKDYFEMLSLEVRQIPFRKSEHRKRLKQKLNNRSDGAIEFKHQNISAILIKYDRPYLIGYKPRFNFQKSLEIAVLDFLENDPSIEEIFTEFAEEPANARLKPVDFNRWTVDFPRALDRVEEPIIEYRRKISHVNFLKKEQENKRLGYLGEELVMEYEKWRLLNHGKENLADKVEWISKDYGDGAGFDILSKNLNGTDRYIEVKTTKLGKFTPIYLTANELKFSQEKEKDFYLYRVFEFSKAPKLFNSNGRLDALCRIEPVTYIGKFK